MKTFIKCNPISLLTEIIKRTPKNNPKRGFWTGLRGQSMFIPVETQTEIINILKFFNLRGINYIYAMPDFRPCSYATVCLVHMSILRRKNFIECDKLCAEYWNSISYLCCCTWTSHTVQNYRKSNSLSWHERNDCTTYDLIPSRINIFFTHLGGIAECKRVA